jgi:hypothetical protein
MPGPKADPVVILYDIGKRCDALVPACKANNLPDKYIAEAQALAAQIEQTFTRVLAYRRGADIVSAPTHERRTRRQPTADEWGGVTFDEDATQEK